MGIAQIIIVGIGLSLDVFAYCLYRGAVISEIKKSNLLKLIAFFAGFQMGMLAIGNGITRIPAINNLYRSANLLWMVLAAITFFALGIYMIVKAYTRRNRKYEEVKHDKMNYSVILFWAFLTSIDALIAGVGFGFLGFALIGSVLVLGIITAASVLLGIWCGYRLGCAPMNKFVLLGGLMVLIGGVDIFARYLSILF